LPKDDNIPRENAENTRRAACAGGSYYRTNARLLGSESTVPWQNLVLQFPEHFGEPAGCSAKGNSSNIHFAGISSLARKLPRIA
jgi:hypothetical protein